MKTTVSEDRMSEDDNVNELYYKGDVVISPGDSGGHQSLQFIKKNRRRRDREMLPKEGDGIYIDDGINRDIFSTTNDVLMVSNDDICPNPETNIMVSLHNNDDKIHLSGYNFFKTWRNMQVQRDPKSVIVNDTQTKLQWRRLRIILSLLLFITFLIIVLNLIRKPPKSSIVLVDDKIERERFRTALFPLLSESSRRAHLLSSSPQSMALDWLYNHDFQNYNFGRRIQRYVLATFYFSTDGNDSWKQSDDWLSKEEDECKWFPGYEDQGEDKCDDGFNMLYLNLPNNGLRGTLPDELALLSRLETLDLSNNFLEGTLSTWIGNMERISRISLQKNSFNGTIPYSLIQLSTLEVLDLSSNNFIGIDLLNMSKNTFGNLVELSLGSNKLLSGKLSDSLGALSDLQSFLVGDTSLYGTIPTEMFSISNLRWFEATNTEIEGSIPTEIGLATKLQFIRLAQNKLSGTLPTEIGLLQHLQFLSLSNNKITGAIPTEMGEITSMLAMYLDSNNFNGIIPSEIGKLSNIDAIHLTSNLFAKQRIPPEICNLTTTRDLPSSEMQVSCDIIKCSCCFGEDGKSCNPITTSEEVEDGAGEEILENITIDNDSLSLDQVNSDENQSENKGDTPIEDGINETSLEKEDDIFCLHGIPDVFGC